VIISPLKITWENCSPDKIEDMKYVMSKEKAGKLAVIQGAVEGKYTIKEAGRITPMKNLEQKSLS